MRIAGNPGQMGHRHCCVRCRRLWECWREGECNAKRASVCDGCFLKVAAEREDEQEA